MYRNLSNFDRILRLLVGTGFLAYAIAGGPVWSYTSLYFIATGAWGFSPLYWLLGVNRPKTR